MNVETKIDPGEISVLFADIPIHQGDKDFNVDIVDMSRNRVFAISKNPDSLGKEINFPLDDRFARTLDYHLKRRRG